MVFIVLDWADIKIYIVCLYVFDFFRWGRYKYPLYIVLKLLDGVHINIIIHIYWDFKILDGVDITIYSPHILGF